MRRLVRWACAVTFAVSAIGVMAAPASSAASAPCTSDPVGSVTRLYLAYFLRAPDAGGLAFWLDRCNRGVSSLVDISDAFAGSPEFNLRYGALNSTAFVTLVYRNVLNRDPDAPGLQASVAFLGRGARRGEVMLGFSESPEFKAKQAGPSAPTPAPAPAPSTSPTTTTPRLTTNGPVNIGSPQLFADGSSIQVYSYDNTTSSFWKPASGNKFTSIDVQFCAGDKTVHYNELGFSVGGPDNRRYQSTVSIKEPSLIAGELTPKACIRGYTTFEVPETPPMTTIFWEYPGWGAPVQWSLCHLTGC